MKSIVLFVPVCVTVLVGCHSEGAFEASESAQLSTISITPTDKTTYLPVSYTATGEYDDSSQSDITNEVTWSASPTSIADIDSDGIATPQSVGVTQIEATLDGVTSNTSTLHVVGSGICGHVLGNEISTSADGGLNNTDTTNAKGECLKIIQLSDASAWYSSPPSLAVMDALGYEESDDANNTGDTYAIAEVDYGLSDGEFARFRQDGIDATASGVDGQFDRWCSKLASLKFAGKTTWRRPTEAELSSLFNESNASAGISDSYGWPDWNAFYWTSTKSSLDDTQYVNMNFALTIANDPSSETTPDNALYGVCISDN